MLVRWIDWIKRIGWDRDRIFLSLGYMYIISAPACPFFI